MEWGQLPQNKNCKHFSQWVEHFYAGGYVPLDSGKPPDWRKSKNIDKLCSCSSVLLCSARARAAMVFALYTHHHHPP